MQHRVGVEKDVAGTDALLIRCTHEYPPMYMLIINERNMLASTMTCMTGTEIATT